MTRVNFYLFYALSLPQRTPVSGVRSAVRRCYACSAPVMWRGVNEMCVWRSACASDTCRISILYLLDLDGPVRGSALLARHVLALSRLGSLTLRQVCMRGSHRWDPGMRIPVQVCAYLSIPGLGSPDWVTLDSVTSNTYLPRGETIF